MLAAGKSSRFFPFTEEPKSMIRLLGKPIIVHTIEGLKKAGIKSILIVVSQDSPVRSYLGSGKTFGVDITYVEQKKPLGMGDALLCAQKHIRGEFLLLNAYHAEVGELVNDIILTKKKGTKGVVVSEERENTWEYGVLKIVDGKLSEVIEKPKRGEEPSKSCIVGIYLLDRIFLETLKSVPYEHYQFEKALSAFCKKQEVCVLKTKIKTLTLKYPWDLLLVKNFLLSRVEKAVGANTKVAKSAEITGNVFIGENVKIMDGARIKGPCFIGNNAFIGDNSVLRGGVDVEENAVVGSYMEVKNSLIMKGAHTHSGFIGDSIVGESARIGAQFCTANVRIDRNPITVIVNSNKVDTGLKYLGAIIGPSVNIGIKSSTMPGVVVGSEATIGPSTVVLKNVTQGTRYYTKFQEVVEEGK